MMTDDVIETLEGKVRPDRAVLLVVDVQNDFLADGGAFDTLGKDTESVRRVVPTISTLIDSARSAGVLVTFVKYVQAPWTESDVQLEQRRRGRGNLRVCGIDTWGAEFYVVKPDADEPVIVKHRYSAFVDTDLDVVLRSKKIRTLVLTGVATNGCVESTARDGFMKDYYIVMVDDACAAFAKTAHDATCENVRDALGVVVTSSQLCGHWATASQPASAAKH